MLNQVKLLNDLLDHSRECLLVYFRPDFRQYSESFLVIGIKGGPAARVERRRTIHIEIELPFVRMDGIIRHFRTKPHL